MSASVGGCEGELGHALRAVLKALEGRCARCGDTRPPDKGRSPTIGSNTRREPENAESDGNALGISTRALAKGQASLQTKLDLVVRQLDALSDGQKSLQKTLQNMGKTCKAASLHPQSGEGRGDQLERPQSVVTPTRSSVQTRNDRDSSRSWAHNLFLLGDEVWMNLHGAADIQAEIQALGQAQNLRISCKKGETLARLYDRHRRKVLFALPLRAHRVALSIGTADLIQADLLTLQEASLGEVRKKNEAKLKALVDHMLEMALSLVGQNKSVLILLPPQGTQLIEVFKHWEDLLVQEVKKLNEANVRLLNLPALMRSSLANFGSYEEFLQNWFAHPTDNLLSEYGARRLFDLLQRAARHRPVVRAAPLSELECLRCLKVHSGGEGACQSKLKACRRCGECGHFANVHDVADPTIQKRIRSILGKDLVFTPPSDQASDRASKRTSPEEEIPSGGKRVKSVPEVRPWGSCSRILDDWYQ